MGHETRTGLGRGTHSLNKSKFMNYKAQGREWLLILLHLH